MTTVAAYRHAEIRIRLLIRLLARLSIHVDHFIRLVCRQFDE